MSPKDALGHQVLVLNKNWQAVKFISLKKAISTVFKTYANGMPRAKIVDDRDFQLYSWNDWSKLRSEDTAIISTSGNIRSFKIICLTTYGKVPRHAVTFNRKNLYLRDNYRCCYCGKRPGSENLSIDHIIPKSQGGPSNWLNCCLACIKCNIKKSNKSLNDTGMKLIQQPYIPKFNLYKNMPIMHDSWRAFISDAYWTVQLQNDG